MLQFAPVNLITICTTLIFDSHCFYDTRCKIIRACYLSGLAGTQGTAQKEKHKHLL